MPKQHRSLPMQHRSKPQQHCKTPKQLGVEGLLEHPERISKTGDRGPVEQSRGMLKAAGDEGSLEHPGGMLKAKDAGRVKLGVYDLVPYKNLQMLDEEPIGSGAFGDVYRAVHKDWGCRVAYKKLDVRFITENSRKQDLKNEAEIHHLLRYPHIVSLLGVVFEQNNYGLVLEYLPYGSLEEFLTNMKDKTGRSFSVPWKLKLKMAYDVCGGMSYLHTLQSPIIHGDLKIQNLLIGDHLIVKISDFGLSKWKDFQRSHTKPVGVVRGTPSHVPPEHWLDADLRPDEKFDVYSFSIALWEIFTEDQAYASGRDRISELVISCRRPSLDKLPRDLPTVVSAVIENCWQQQPIKRPTFSELMSPLKDFTPSQHESEESIREVLVIYHKEDTVSEHGRKMNRVSSKLSDIIRRTDQILTHLLEERAVTPQEFEEISSQSTIYNLTRHLLDLLSSKPVTAYKCFLDALTTTDQQHLHKLLETDENINLDHKATLIDNYTFLKTNIVVSNTGLLDHLQQTGVLDNQEMEEIQAKKTRHKRTDRLLYYIQRTSQEQYQIFLEALRISKQEFITEVLETNSNSRASTKAALLDMIASKNKSSHERVYSRISSSNEASTSKETSTPISKISHQGGSIEEKNSKLNEAIDRGRSTLFLSKSSVVDVIPGADKGDVCGIAALGNQLFVARHRTTSVEVYDTNNMTTTPRLLKIRDKTLEYPRLAACSHYNCLYVSCWGSDTESVTYRVELSNSSVSRWGEGEKGETGGWSLRCAMLSITTAHTVLCCASQRVEEYRMTGELMREIRLDSSIDLPSHCIQLSDGNFVICHIGSQHRVCIVDASGRIIKSYGGSPGSGVDQLNYPRQLLVDKYDHVFVADRDNYRVQLLSPALSLLGTVQIPGHQLDRPVALHFDQINHRLYVNRHSDVLVVELSNTEK